MILRQLVVGNLHTNCYILGEKNGGNGIVIDPGGSIDRILEVVKEEELKIKYVISTHGHDDHISGSLDLARVTQASICVHPADLTWDYDWGKDINFIKLEDGMLLDVGMLQLRIIHTPGHTRGSVSVQVSDLLFTGDLLFKGSVGRTDLPGSSTKELYASLKEKIAILPPQIKIYPGHGDETTLENELKYNPFLKELN